jgi:hypothetical protein
MKVRYSDFVSDPALRNTETHLPNHVAAVLIATGQATEIKPRTIAEFISQHAVAGPNNTALEFVPEPGVWKVCEGLNGRWFQWKHQTSTERTDSIDVARKNGCPEDVIERFQRGN